jgi:hypothetical protein
MLENPVCTGHLWLPQTMSDLKDKNQNQIINHGYSFAETNAELGSFGFKHHDSIAYLHFIWSLKVHQTFNGSNRTKMYTPKAYSEKARARQLSVNVFVKTVLTWT